MKGKGKGKAKAKKGGEDSARDKRRVCMFQDFYPNPKSGKFDPAQKQVQFTKAGDSVLAYIRICQMVASSDVTPAGHYIEG